VTKPFNGDELVVAVDRALECGRLRKENHVLRAALPAPAKTTTTAPMIGSCSAMTTLRGQLGRISASQGTVLISGESGTGKELAARAIHEASPRAGRPFLAINCAALSASLLESELFGHEKGAFTGADKMRKGRFEIADGGTLLLDEISEIPTELQAKLLRVLQEQAFERVGSSTTMRVDVRVIATTNRCLASEVEAGRFRRDLFFRVNVLPVEVAPLRDRLGDLEALATHFLGLIALREGREAKAFAGEAMDALRAYGWPGNIRELQNICERASVLSSGGVIDAALIAPWLHQGQSALPAPSATATANCTVDEPEEFPEWMICNGQLQLEDIEREAILATLARNGGHRQKSASALGIGVRTLGLKLKKWKDERIVEASV
jgi:DNA-binding NtrC family response regulator